MEPYFSEDATYHETYAHLIFSTRERLPFLLDAPVRDAVCAHLAETCPTYHAHCLLATAADDHVHLVVMLGAETVLDDLVSGLKDSTAEWVRAKGGILADFGWQHAYVALSEDRRSASERCARLADHWVFHRDVDYKTEVKAILTEANLSWTSDLWD